MVKPYCPAGSRRLAAHGPRRGQMWSSSTPSWTLAQLLVTK
jgi:hypothetical protein